MSLLIDKLLALSTGHLPQATMDNIEDFIIAYPNEYGAFVYISPEALQEPIACPHLDKLVSLARVLGVTWLKFDRDAQEIEAPLFEW